MNVLVLSFDYTLLLEAAATGCEARRRQFGYVQELRRKVPGSRIWIVVRSAPGMAAQSVTIAESLELYPTPSSAIGFISAAYRHGCELCSRHGIDLITSQSPFSDGLAAWLLRSRCKAKWLAQLHTSSLDNLYWLAESRGNYLRAWLGKFMLRRADAVRVVSEGAAAWLQRSLGIARDKVFVIPVGTALVAESMPVLKERTASQNVLFVGRFVFQKGVATLVYAFQHVKQQCHEAILMIVGDGPEKRNLEELRSTLGLQESVHFAGLVPYKQLPEFYTDADVVVVPSLYEPYGRVIAEAMSFGRAVVATDTEGARDLIRDGETGFIVPVQDVQALASKISYLLQNPQVARKVGEAARQFVKRTQDPGALCMAQVEMWLKVTGR